MIKALLARTGKKLRQLVRGEKKRQTESVVVKQEKESPQEPARSQEVSAERQECRRRPDRPKKPKWTLEQFPVEPTAGKSRFHDFSLPLALMHAIADLDFKYCSPIQEKALPSALEGKDLIARAGTGTGKSAVFLVALFTRLLREQQPLRKPGLPRALIIAPTRELVMQIAKDGNSLAKYTPLRIVAVYGGTNLQKQEQQIRDRPADVLVATPGRLLDYVSRKAVSLGQVNIMVLDEADRMLDMGFIPDVRRIMGQLPAKEQRQTLLFSATVNEDVRRLAAQWCVKPVYIESDPEQVAVDTVEQVIYTVTSEEKYTVLYNLISSQEHARIMVFTNMKSEAARLHERLRANGIQAVLLTGDVPQQKRMARLERFRGGETEVMIATDVAGRGIHIDGISHVVNYTLPYEPEDYVHRIGRTGRAGENGIAISFACEEGAFHLPAIEEYIGRPLACVPPEEELLALPPEPAPAASVRPKNRNRRRRR